MATGYRVQTRDEGAPWRTVRTWPDQAAAVDDARALFGQSREIEGVRVAGRPFTVRLHPFVRVKHGARLVLDLDATRKDTAAA
jgi:hypothetical protein